MPFKKMRKAKGKEQIYRGPSGRKFNAAQVRLYYARGKSFDKPRR